MNTDTLDRELRAANPIASPVLAALDLDECEASLGQALMGEPVAVDAGSAGADRRARPLPHRRRRILVGLAAAATAAAAVVLFVGGSHGPEAPARAYGAELVRYAESTPLLLLDQPGWRVKGLEQQHGGDGTLGFVTDTGRADQRWVKLYWLPRDQAGVNLRAILHPRIDRTPGRRLTTELPNLGAVVHIDTRAETAPRYGHPGDPEMTAVWLEGGRLLYFESRVSSLAAFRKRLEGLRRVEAQAWLDAMPPQVVKAAEFAPTVEEMLRGIPLPPGFDPSQVPHRGLAKRAATATRQRRQKPNASFSAAKSSGRSSARWRRKAPIPRLSSNTPRRCTAAAGTANRYCAPSSVPTVFAGRSPRVGDSHLIPADAIRFHATPVRRSG